MGKAVSKGLKYKAEVLLKELPERFGSDFEKNKTALFGLELGLAKKNRNIVAGYISRLAKQAAENKK